SSREASDQSRPRLSSIRKRPLVAEVSHDRSSCHHRTELRQTPSKFRRRDWLPGQRAARHGCFVWQTQRPSQGEESRRSRPSTRLGRVARFAEQTSGGLLCLL